MRTRRRSRRSGIGSRNRTKRNWSKIEAVAVVGIHKGSLDAFENKTLLATPFHLCAPWNA